MVSFANKVDSRHAVWIRCLAVAIANSRASCKSHDNFYMSFCSVETAPLLPGGQNDRKHY